MYIRFYIIFNLLMMFSIQANAIVVGITKSQIDQNKGSDSLSGIVDQLEEASHNKAKNFSAVCAIITDDPSDDMLDVGTGTYFAKNGRSGFVITSARVAFKAINKLQFLFLSFSPKFRNDNNKIAAKNIYIHPDFNPMTKYADNDIAIIEFDTKFLPKNIVPLSIDAATDYSKDYFFEGAMIGYGDFGANMSTLTGDCAIHYG